MTITAAPALLTLSSLSDDDKITYARLRKQLQGVQRVNNERIALFEAAAACADPGDWTIVATAVPPLS